MSRSFLRCTAGAAAMEFAVLAPAFFLMLFGIVEYSRLAWTRQTLDDIAYATARCMSVSTTCASSTQQKTFAVNRGTALGVKFVAANVTPTSNTTCKGYASSNSVTITAAFSSPADGLIPGVPSQITSRACFPVLS